MGLTKDVKFCMKLNRLKDFIISPTGLFLIAAAITTIVLIRNGLKEESK